ncbi:MAG: esterase family protein [Cohnella sp.]|nr:esterase family protein [Cohnella sp.]
MAWMECHFYSEILDLTSTMQLLLPQQPASQMAYPWNAQQLNNPSHLLHGLSDDSTVWVRMSAIERYTAPHGPAVVMPDVHRSYYSDKAYGLKYWTFHRQNFVAYLSMGGRSSE